MMRMMASLRMALSALRLNLLRSLLTMLGIIIGVAAVIATVAVGSGARSQIDAQIKSLGTNIMILTSGPGFGGGVRIAGGGTPLTEDDGKAVGRDVAGIDLVSSVRQGSGQLIYQGTNWATQLQGVDANYLTVREWPLESGRFFSDQESRSGAKVGLIGKTVERELFHGASAIGQTIRVNRLPVKVIGILVGKGQSLNGQDQDDAVLVPLKTAQSRLLGGSNATPKLVNLVFIKTTVADTSGQVAEAVRQVMRQRQHVRPNASETFRVRNLSELVQARTATTKTLTALLGVVAAVSLVVGGIGIMNIMLVSVIERTREIGVRMAVGARPSDIRRQFLVEAILLSLLGGIVGALIGIGVSALAGSLAGWPILLEPSAVLLALAFAGVVGIVFGYLPANRAAGLDPIMALRTE